MSDSGQLASVKFQVVRYGSTILNISLTRTHLLSSQLKDISFTKTNGYFSNKLLGDIDGDRDVDGDDFVKLAENHDKTSN